MVQVVADIQDTVKYHEEVLNFYRDQLDDYENRDRRQNIRIKGLPETILSPDLLPTVQRLFRQIMGDSSPENIEVDRVHRIPSYATPNSERPRDIICKLHKYTVKESIMKITRSKSEIIFDGAYISLYPDLSRRTLMQRRTVKLLLEALRAVETNYRWGFPFSLTASRNGKTATLRTKDDLQLFVETLDLLLTEFVDWRRNNFMNPLQRPAQWQQMPNRYQRRNQPKGHEEI